MIERKKIECDICEGFYSSHVIERHKKVCKGKVTNKPKLQKCPFCNKNFNEYENIPNHVRWCRENPKRDEYVQKMKNLVHGRSCPHTEESRKRISLAIKKKHQDGTYIESQKRNRENPSFKGKHHTEETKKRLRESALKSCHRRLRKSTRLYKKMTGEKILLDSSWEEALAKRLDQLNIAWERPDPIRYEINEEYHNYFPDFYLPDYDLFLDPKNPQAYRVQLFKIEILKKLLPNLIFLTSLDDCSSFEIEKYKIRKLQKIV